jgi:hypothetical protein
MSSFGKIVNYALARIIIRSHLAKCSSEKKEIIKTKM